MAKKKASKKTTHKHEAHAAHPARKPKKNNSWVGWVIAIIVIVVILLLIRSASKKDAMDTEGPTGPETPTTTPGEGGEEPTGPQPGDSDYVEPGFDPGDGIIDDPTIETGNHDQDSRFGTPTNQDTDLARDIVDTDKLTLVSNVKCAFNEEHGVRLISLKLTNTNTERSYMISEVGVQKGYGTYFNLRGNVDYTPGCNADELKPGESTMCTQIGPENPVYQITAGTNRVSLQTPTDDGKYNTEAIIVECPGEKGDYEPDLGNPIGPEGQGVMADI